MSCGASEYALKFCQSLTEKILDYEPDPTDRVESFPPEMVEAIHQLWEEPIITKIMDEHSSEFHLMDSTG